MFGKCIETPLFDPSFPSMGIKGRNTPDYCCPAGLARMAEEFRKYPEQYEINMKALTDANRTIIISAKSY